MYIPAAAPSLHAPGIAAESWEDKVASDAFMLFYYSTLYMTTVGII